MENSIYYQFRLEKKQDYGHQAVTIMLSCDGVTFNYAVVMYDKSKSKVNIITG